MPESSKGLAVFDVDRTIIDGYVQKYFINFLYKHRVISFSTVLKVYGWFILYKLNIVKNPAAPLNLVLGKIYANDRSKLNELIHEFCKNDLEDKIFADAITEFNKLKKEGFKIILVSSIVQDIIDVITKYLSLDEGFGTQLEMINGNLHVSYLQYGENKLLTLKKYSSLKGYSRDQIIAYGDHYTDRYVLEYSGKAIAVNPDKQLTSYANIKNWSIKIFK